MELLKTSVILYQRFYCLERNTDLSPFEVAFEVKTDSLISITLLYNRSEGLYVMLSGKDYEFFEEIHWLSPTNNYEKHLYPSLEGIEEELTRIVKKFIGIDLQFTNIRGTMLFNLLLLLDLIDQD